VRTTNKKLNASLFLKVRTLVAAEGVDLVDRNAVLAPAFGLSDVAEDASHDKRPELRLCLCAERKSRASADLNAVG
jgi:hypothetical protein